VGTGVIFPGGVTRPGRGVYHSLLSSAESENKWSYTSFPYIPSRRAKRKIYLLFSFEFNNNNNNNNNNNDAFLLLHCMSMIPV
jgi:hypothetical protein